jgi:serine/threonine-protein kinase
VLEGDPPLPSTLEPRLAKELDRVLLKALAKRPETRFRSARQFLEALLAAFDNEPLPDSVADTGEQEVTAASVEETPSGTKRFKPANLGALRRAIAAAPPPAAEARPEPQATAPRASGVRRPRLLFVDDEERVTNALKGVFRDTYDVVTASSGQQALELARTQAFHVIVSDQRMPGMLGVELLREVKALRPNAVRMLLTGYSDLAAIVGSVNDGEVFRFVSKPWNQDDLQGTIAEAVTIAIALEASPPPRAAVRSADDVVALVLDDPTMARATREMAGDLCRVVHAPTLDDALHALAVNEVALLMCDLESQRVDITVLLKLLKQEHPATLVIVTTSRSDSEMIISLINEARIFRFINKPVNLTLLQSHVVAALERYYSFKQSPQLVSTQRARRSAVAQESTAGRSILDRLRSITTRITAPFR